ncbi:hypothetical protein KUCAC02_010421 [Chaenocephalus aceratus]|uniref:Uncharacterized protein n=1 Tax=Chaenocephalus aceratus TaxID=36190 RepID=A0ACB9VZ59_CHAAC|nr:hypothetical protein KUCAC02_010421 [Chaenocephalus aceratus]
MTAWMSSRKCPCMFLSLNNMIHTNSSSLKRGSQGIISAPLLGYLRLVSRATRPPNRMEALIRDGGLFRMLSPACDSTAPINKGSAQYLKTPGVCQDGV